MLTSLGARQTQLRLKLSQSQVSPASTCVRKCVSTWTTCKPNVWRKVFARRGDTKFACSPICFQLYTWPRRRISIRRQLGEGGTVLPTGDLGCGNVRTMRESLASISGRLFPSCFSSQTKPTTLSWSISLSLSADVYHAIYSLSYEPTTFSFG